MQFYILLKSSGEGSRNSKPVRAGELVGWRASGTEVRAPADGFIVFPNVNATPGAEWFYFAIRDRRLA